MRPLYQALTAYIDGPLSPDNGGSLDLQHVAAGFTHAGKGEDDDAFHAEGDGRRSFSIGGTTSPLFDYQDEIVANSLRWLDSGSPRSAMVSMPTGAGKTRTAAWLCRVLIERQQTVRILWVAPAVELIRQACDAFRYLWDAFRPSPEVRCHYGVIPDVYGSASEKPCVAFVSTQYASKNLAALRQFAARLLVFDEAHQAAAATFRRVVTEQMGLAHGHVLGLTATPGRGEVGGTNDLASLFGSQLVTPRLLGDNPINTLRQMGVLCPLKFHRLPLPKRWDSARVVSLATRASVDELALNPYRFWSVVENLASRAGDAKSLVFGASIAHCISLVIALRAKGVCAELVSHDMTDEQRRKTLARFAAGETSVLVNKGILATGYDCPGISDIFLATPIRSAVLWEQIVGRVSRGPAVGGTPVGNVWELDDHRAMHKDVLSYSRYTSEAWG